MDVDLGLFDAGRRLYQRHHLVLNTLRHLHDVAPVDNGDDHIDDDLLFNKLDLDALADGLEPDQLGDLRAGGVGKPGNAFDLADRGTNDAGNDFFRKSYYFNTPCEKKKAVLFISILFS